MRFKGIYHWLSNNSYLGSSVRHNGTSHISATNMYQSAKSNTEEDIRNIANLKPVDAERYWDDRKPKKINKLNVMYSVIKTKFSMSRIFNILLSLKGDIVNDDTDEYWGSNNHVGHNHLGKLITSFRDRMLEVFTVTNNYKNYLDIDFLKYRKVITVNSFYELNKIEKVIRKNKDIETLLVLTTLESRTTRVYDVYKKLRSYSKYPLLDMVRSTKEYCGFGIEPPVEIAVLIRKIAIYLSCRGYTWRGRGNGGIDTDFGYYIKKKELTTDIIYDDPSYKRGRISPLTLPVVKNNLGGWDELTKDERLKYCLDTHMILGDRLTKLPDFNICFIPLDNEASIEFNYLLDICDLYNIVTHNLDDIDTRKYWEDKVSYIDLKKTDSVDV